MDCSSLGCILAPFVSQMTAVSARSAGSFQIQHGAQALHTLLRRQLAGHVAVDHDDRRQPATAQTAGGAEAQAIVGRRLTGVDADVLLQRRKNLGGAFDIAGGDQTDGAGMFALRRE